MNSQEQEVQKQIRRELVSIANAMIEEKTSLIEGCRKICELKDSLKDCDEKLFTLFVGVESEMDEYPLGKVREKYDESYLKNLDSEIKSYLSRMQSEILFACKKIVQAYG